MNVLATSRPPYTPSTSRRRWWASAVISLAATIFTGVAWLSGWIPALDRVTGDLLLRTASPLARSSPVNVIVIDDAAVDQFGPMPWPRARLARLVEGVRTGGARAVVIDLILSEPGTANGDADLAGVLTRIPAVLAAAIDADGNWLLPLDEFGGRHAAAHAYGEVGPDGVVRTVAATKQAADLSLPALSLAAARTLRPELPISPGTELRPCFRPAPQHLATFSAATALADGFPAGNFANELVFIGVSASGAGDQFVVPTGPRHTPVPGVLAHASAAASILGDRLLHLPGPGWSLTMACVLAAGVQILRDRRGVFDLTRFLWLTAGVGVIALASLRFGLVLVPVTALIVTMVVSALIRETVESRLTHLATGKLLHAMRSHASQSPGGPVPHTARARLDALTDIQRRVLAEDTTRRALLAGMREGVVLWSPDGEVLEANPAAERLWGQVPALEDLVGVGEIPDDQRPHFFRGSYVLSVDLTEVDNGWLAIIRDVTAERILEQRRREMQRLVSHELKTPLASIAGFGETLERYHLSEEELARVAGMIRGEAGRLQEMVTLFLDLERLGAGHWDGEAVPIDVGELVRDRLEILESAARSRKLSIARSIADGCWTHGVPALLDRVVDNLVGNAIKYSRPGNEVDVAVSSCEDSITLTVRDRGVGISEESLPYIFDRFFRVPGTEGTGAGLGLALVKEVVDWHGGCMSVDSEAGVGSTFQVGLRVYEGE